MQPGAPRGSILIPLRAHSDGTRRSQWQCAAPLTDRRDGSRVQMRVLTFDGVIDFDAATRDPNNPKHIRAEFDSGDHLHPQDTGYKAMADTIDLGLLGVKR